VFTVVPYVVKPMASLATTAPTSHVSLATTSLCHRDVIDTDVAEVLDDSASSSVTMITFRPPRSRVTNQVVYHEVSAEHQLLGNRSSEHTVAIYFSQMCFQISQYFDNCRRPILNASQIHTVLS